MKLWCPWLPVVQLSSSGSALVNGDIPPVSEQRPPDSITRGSHAVWHLQLSNAGSPALPQLPGSPALGLYVLHSLAICPNDIPCGAPPASPWPHPGVTHPSEPSTGSTRRNFPQFLLSRWPGVSVYLGSCLAPHSSCQEAIAARKMPKKLLAALSIFLWGRFLKHETLFFFFHNQNWSR